ncbi:hypothetical protein K437DRAFT_228862 [Tilletiaria anomala UBC 951]|uniref:MFS general substrate transporter n=1 Tax=Tilletiaria anomala (strain ATCC 24038 / CBS 436.72 / UBC 951) TaxID=1037660 RepID=A0A066VCH4_TILAU|nr:uncharacterized protein K437DRAFT_228862 [Tilletiaria anomala UBC 951]KDN37993.1 hypothetical protein K437DRAFT_228862 [Tilletiaria anomala UBC 951]
MLCGGAAQSDLPPPGVDVADQPAVLRGPPQLQLPLLTVGAFGWQLVWSMEMAFASPYLIELGLSKSQVAAVLVAGPLSGLIVQPVIGVLADGSTHRWGRRRPFLLVACLLSTAAMFLLAFANDIGRAFASTNDAKVHWISQLCAVFAVFGVDFSVNAIMSMDRSLYIDMVPPSSQGQVSAWAARLAGLGDVLGFLISHLNLPTYAPFSWFPSQLKCLCFMTSFFLLSTHAVTAWTAQERRLVRSVEQHLTVAAVLQHLKKVFRDFVVAARTLPPPFKWIFAVQFFSWLGWFPIMFYSTLWIGSIWSSAQPGGADPVSATRYGAGALFYRAILALLVSIIAPNLVAGGVQQNSPSIALHLERGPVRNIFKHKVQEAELWCFSTFFFALTMFSTLFAELSMSAGLASMLLITTGFSWAIVSWIPYSLVGILVSNDREGALISALPSTQSGNTSGQHFDAEREAFLSDEDRETEAQAADGAENGESSATEAYQQSLGKRDLHERAGTILGLLNIAIVVPQFISTALSSACEYSLHMRPHAT